MIKINCMLVCEKKYFGCYKKTNFNRSFVSFDKTYQPEVYLLLLTALDIVFGLKVVFVLGRDVTEASVSVGTLCHCA